MKRTTKLFLFIVFFISLNGCTNFETSVVQTKKPLMMEQPQKSPPMEQDNDILSSDYTIAEKELDKAILKKDKNAVKAGLKSEFLNIKKKTVQTIEEFNDKTFVPDLITVLEENQSIIGGGTETQIEQNNLNRAVISALEHLTELKFEVSNSLSPEDIEKVLVKSKDWCKSYKKDNNTKD